jgi:hypothetical protein
MKTVLLEYFLLITSVLVNGSEGQVFVLWSNYFDISGATCPFRNYRGTMDPASFPESRECKKLQAGSCSHRFLQ